MLHRQGIEVRLRNGIEGELIPEFDNEPGRNKVAIEAVGGLLLCPEIVIYPEFNWFDADGLYIAVEYGTPTAQIILWAPKPQELDHASEPASFFIPGAKFWDDAKAKAVCFEYCLTNRPVRNDLIRLRELLTRVGVRLWRGTATRLPPCTTGRCRMHRHCCCKRQTQENFLPSASQSL